MSKPDLLTSTQAGAALGVSGRTVLRRAEKGELRVVQKLPGWNGTWLFDRAEIEALAAQQREGAA
jgi:predicted site-specific integrase-resolvase